MPRNITRKKSVKNLFSLLLSRRTDGFLNPKEQSIRRRNPIRLIGRQGRSHSHQHGHARAGGDYR